MTTLAANPPAAPAARSAAAAPRVVNVLRLHLTNKFTTLGLPLLILGFIFLVNYVIWLLIYTSTPEGNREATAGTQYSGSIAYVFIYMAIIAVQVVLRTFPFALGFSITRREFALGSALLFGSLSVIYAAILTVMSYLEDATDGWGVGGHMFSTVWYGTGTVAERFSQEFFGLLFFFFVGAAVAVVYLRWRAIGQTVLWAGLVLVGLGVVALITLTNGWASVGQWFVDAGPYGVVLWTLPVTAVAALFGFFVLRRATPVS
ncbi:ABC transporter permease [Subtercola sp. YIM 133946]|uniref:ABC transporter permease n=1 Tax=Subtercola sp. YIM 133946 TaxID=3118909 RepID=UPI002F93F2F2